MAATERVTAIMLNAEEIDLVRGVITNALDTEIKTGQHQRRVKLYRLSRRLYRARLKLE